MRQLPWLQTSWSDVFMRVTVVWTVNLFLRPSSHVICQNIWIIYTWHDQYIYILPITITLLCTYVYTCKLTLTSHSSIFPVATWAADKGAPWTFNEAILTAAAVHIIQIDRTSTSTKVSICECNCICWHAICEHKLLMTSSSFKCFVLHTGRLVTYGVIKFVLQHSKHLATDTN